MYGLVNKKNVNTWKSAIHDGRKNLNTSNTTTTSTAPIFSPVKPIQEIVPTLQQLQTRIDELHAIIGTILPNMKIYTANCNMKIINASPTIVVNRYIHMNLTINIDRNRDLIIFPFGNSTDMDIKAQKIIIKIGGNPHEIELLFNKDPYLTIPQNFIPMTAPNVTFEIEYILT